MRLYQSGYEDVERYFYSGTGDFFESPNLPAAPTMFRRSYDVDLDLYLYGGRAYDAQKGRFLSEGPTAAGGNRYLNADTRADSQGAGLTHVAETSWSSATTQALEEIGATVGNALAPYARPLQFIGGAAQFVAGAAWSASRAISQAGVAESKVLSANGTGRLMVRP